jgi:Mrp family chromosome partitioning ATPase/capsular polysaccharide biosynthesis protein
MENLDVMGALRRWYGLVLVAALIGGIAGFLIGPPASGGTTRHYQASHILLVDDEEAPEAAAELLAFLATIGDVPVRVAERLGDGSDPQDLTERVTVEPSRLGTVTITATAGDPAEAASLADLFGEEIVAERREELASGFDDRVSAITAELSALSSRAAELTAAVRVNLQDASVTAQLDGVVAQIALLTQERESLTAERASVDVPVRTVQPALAVARPSDAIDVPLGRYGTAIIGALVGLLLGGLAAVVISRYDPRLHGKTDVERSYGYSVIGAIPMLSRRWRRRRDVITVAEPSSAPAEAYRMLRTSLERLLAGPQPVRALPRSTRAAGARNGRTGAVVLISSALPSEGKTTLVANLAATYAQSGRSVVIVSADLRAPSVNEFLDVPPDLGLADIPAESMPASSLLRATNIEGVKMVLDGSTRETRSPADRHGRTSPTSPGDVLEHARSTITDLRKLADIVLIDTPPLLPFNDVGELLPAVDGVLVVARLGTVRVADGERTREALDQLGAPVLGLVLVGVREDSQVSAYYSRSNGSWRRWTSQFSRSVHIVNEPDEDESADADEVTATGKAGERSGVRDAGRHAG